VCLFIKHYKRKIIICVNLGVILFMLLTSLAGISSRSKSSYSAQTHNESPAVRKSPQTVPELGNEMILGSGTPKAHVDMISSRMPSEMGDTSDLELPMLLENDGNLEKAEACRKELEDICILLRRKHAEAKELAVRAIVNNNNMLMLNHPMFEEKICSIQKFANGLRSKKYLFEEVGSINAH